MDNDPLPGTLAFSSANYSINEDGTPIATVTITRTGGASGSVSVTLTPSNGSAIAPNDYDNNPIIINFADGETSKTVTIPITNDTLAEGNETINLSLTNPTGGAILGSQKNAILVIIDNDVQLAFANSTFRVNEDGTPINQVTVVRTGLTSTAVSVNIELSDGTATAPSDYTNNPITVNFAAGETSKTVAIPIINDSVFEVTETINLALINPTSGATLGTQKTATLNIVDNDAVPGVIQFSNASYAINENGTPVTAVTLTRTGGSDGAVSVTVNLSNGTATAGSDYNSSPITVNFADGETSKTVNIPIINDSQFEPDETINLTLSNPTGGAAIAPSKLNIPNTSVLGTNVFSGITFTVASNLLPSDTLSIEVSGTVDLANGQFFANAAGIIVAPSVTNTGQTPGQTSTATSGAPLVGSPYGALLIGNNALGFFPLFSATSANGLGNITPPTSLSLTNVPLSNIFTTSGFTGLSKGTVLEFRINDTNTIGNSGQFVITSAGTGANTAVLTIINDDVLQPGTVSFNTANYTVNENGTANINLIRTGGSDGEISVTLTPTNGTATAGSDYNNSPITVTFANGETSKTVTIPLIDDSNYESNETVNLTLSNPTGGATLGTQKTAILNIIDNDAVPGVIQFSNASYSINENGTPVTAVTLTRTGGSDGAVSVTVNLSNGTATAGSDYNSSPITVNFADGETSKTVTIPIIDDSILESNETINLTLTNPTNGVTIGTQKSAVVNIIDNDFKPTLTVNIVAEQITEGNTIQGIVTRNTDTTEPLTVTLVNSDNTQITVPTTVIIPAGANSVNFSITAVDDNFLELPKNYSIIASAQGFISGSDSIAVIDNDAVTLTLTIDTTNINENGGKAIATVTRNVVTDIPLVVQLSSSDTTEATVPATVTIAANQASATFEIQSVDDTIVDGTQPVIITAKPVYTNTNVAVQTGNATANLNVVDNESPSLKLTIDRDVISETGTATATITRNTNTDSALVVNLNSSDTTEATVPNTVTIAAGQTSATFAITGVSDGISDGSQTVNITASATGLNSGTDSLEVTDINVADLAITNLQGIQPTYTGKQSQFTYTVANNGIIAASGSWKDKVYLSVDNKLDANDTLLGEFGLGSAENPANFAPGTSYERTVTYFAPRTPGQYYLIASTDTGNTVNEGGVGESNNTTITPLTVTPAYRAIAYTDTETAIDGNYTLTVNGSGIQDLSGNAGTGTQSESWVMDTIAPAVPTNISVTATPSPNSLQTNSASLGVLNQFGQIRVNSTSVTVTGDLGETGLRVSLIDKTTSQTLGQATVTGTSFSSNIQLPSPGSRDVDIRIQDAAGNITTTTLNLFADVTKPAITEFLNVPQNSVTTPVNSIDVRFSEQINLATFDKSDITLTRNGENITLPETLTVEYLSGTTYRINGLGNSTTTPGTYQLRVDGTTIQDNAGNSGDAAKTTSFTIAAPATPGITVTQSGGNTAVTEGGNTDSYTLVLRSQPTADVTVTLNVGNQITTDKTTLTFTPTNWNIAQTVTVTAVNDTIPEGNHTSTITHTVTSTDTNYSNTTLPAISVSITDNDAEIRGMKWHDIDGDGVKDSGESGLQNWTIYLDNNTNGQLDNGEISTITDANGNYQFTNLRPGIYTVAEVQQPGWKQTFPGVNITTTNADIPLSIPSLDIISPGDNNQVQINFNAANYIVNEDGTAVTEVWVTRTGNLSSAVSATLSFIDGTAKGCGCAASSVNNDFNNIPFTVTFAQNETSKLIYVQNALLGNPNAIKIRNDSKVEGTEYFTIQLTNPTGGAVIGNQGTATVTIIDDEAPSDITVTPPLDSPGTTISSVGDSKATSLINLNNFWADSRFANIKGNGLTSVIIDTGIDLNHPIFGADADNNGIADKIVYQYDFADNDADASDKNNHGSHIASIFTSVAPNSNIIALKVFKDSGGGSFSDLEKALQWVAANRNTYNIASVNLSIGDSQNWTTATSRYGIGDELAAIASQNIIINAAAGNSFYQFGSNPGLAYPAIDPNVIAVGAVWSGNFGGPKNFVGGAIDYTTTADQIASFSQRDPQKLDVFAPGILITGANANGGTTTMGGTSQAAAYITGVATLAQQIAQEKLGRKLSVNEFRNLLDTTSVIINDGDNENDNVTNTGQNYPRVDLVKLAEGILNLNSSTSSPNPVNSGNNSNNNSTITFDNTINLVHTVNLTAGQVRTGVDFGNQQIAANQAPTVAQPIADQTATEDTAFTFTIPENTFTDVDAGDILTYSATLENSNALPDWLEFDVATRTFSGTPTNSEVGSLNIKVTATDKAGAKATDSFAITVANTNDAPTLQSAIADQNATEDAAFSFTIPENTFADVDAGDSLTYSATLENGNPLPNWLTFDAATRTLSGTPTNSEVGTLNIKVTATDKSGATATDSFAITVANTNDAPTLASAIADQTATEDTAFTFQIPADTFSDIDAGDILTYSAIVPSWLTFNATTRTFSGTPGNGDVGTVNIKVTATDSAGASVEDTFSLTVINTNDAPTVGSAIADQTATTNSLFSFTLPVNTFLDVDAGDSLSYTASLENGSPLPTWLTFNPATRSFSGTPTLTDVGTLNIKVQATDTNNASANDIFAINITNLINNIAGTASNDVIQGTANNDFIQGLGGNDQLFGLTGNDTLDGGTGKDTMTGGLGDDTYIVENSGDKVVENPDQGTDTVRSSISYTLGDYVENLVLTGSSGLAGTGNALNNLITGNSGSNTLDGKAGNDTLSGGLGNDNYIVDSFGDVVIENANEGTDTVSASVSYTLTDNVERLNLTGTADIDGTGNSLSNTITGNSGNNILTGGEGNDSLNGGAGNDILNGGVGNDSLTGSEGNDILNSGDGNDSLNGGVGDDSLNGGVGNDSYTVDSFGDVITENANEGTDTVSASVSYTLTDNIERLILTGKLDIDGTGNSLSNTITGNVGNNILNGGDGNDSLNGGAGNDSLNGGVGNDSLTGGDGNDSLTGGDGNDTLLGQAGNDVLTGGFGSDKLTGGTGNDWFVFTALTDAGDTITDFEVGQDKIILTQLLSSIKYSGSNPITDGYIKFAASGKNTIVQIDPDGFGSQLSLNLTTLQNRTVTQINDTNNFVF
nr:Calx-beta domain-containing protein [Tolypothrix sp. PCC 7910]